MGGGGGGGGCRVEYACVCLFKISYFKKKGFNSCYFFKNRKYFSSNICDLKESARQLCSQLTKSLTNVEYV